MIFFFNLPLFELYLKCLATLFFFWKCPTYTSDIALTLVQGPGRLSPLLLIFRPATNRDRPAVNRDRPVRNRDRPA